MIFKKMDRPSLLILEATWVSLGVRKRRRGDHCPRSFRFVIGRKNRLFSGSPKGARASAALYSLIETAKAGGL